MITEIKGNNKYNIRICKILGIEHFQIPFYLYLQSLSPDTLRLSLLFLQKSQCICLTEGYFSCSMYIFDECSHARWIMNRLLNQVIIFQYWFEPFANSISPTVATKHMLSTTQWEFVRPNLDLPFVEDTSQVSA